MLRARKWTMEALFDGRRSLPFLVDERLSDGCLLILCDAMWLLDRPESVI